MAADAFHPNLRHVPASELDRDTAQTSGMLRLSAISAHRVGSQKLWMGQTHVGPAQRSGDHHHGEAETAIYVVSGKPEFVFLDERTGEETRLKARARRLRVRPALHATSRGEQRSGHRGRRRDRTQHPGSDRGQPGVAWRLMTRPESIVVASGRPHDPGAPVNTPIVLTAPYCNDGEYNHYARSHQTDTRRALEEALGALEGGIALAFASGMAAIAAVVELPTGRDGRGGPGRGVLRRVTIFGEIGAAAAG